ncbi:MAG: CpsD/CapB family tyrosine-protein kinase [bacterium]|nr:CpsD/CapB family tyrosine-protein kinase [bacterium]
MSIYRDLFKWAEKNTDSESPIEPDESPDEVGHPLSDDLPRVLSNDLQVLQENIEAARAQHPLKSVLITSSVRREGSSTITANWGKLLSRERLDGLPIDTGEMIAGGVLLIDGNLRKPKLHSLFDLDRKRGMTELLTGELQLDEVLKGAPRKNLWVITAGKPAANPADLLGSLLMKGLLDECRRRFQFILIDSAPATLHAETLALAKQVESVLLVIQAGHTRWEVAASAKKALLKVNPRLLGVVLNQRKYYIPEWIYQRI